jgi:hypothetical protein
MPVRSLPARWSRAALMAAVVALLALVVAPALAPGSADAANPVAPWRLMTSPNRGTLHNHLQEVSCVNNTRCVAVGFSQDPSTLFRSNIAATLVNDEWRLSTVPQRGTASNNLWNVSCVSTTRCIAVGFYANLDAGYYRTLIASFNGSTWKLESSPNRANQDNYLFGVDCADATHCVAVGRSFNQTSSKSLVLTLDGGTTWKMPGVPLRPNSDNLLADVSCATATSCKAVGYTVADTDNTNKTLVLSRTGNTWSIDTSADRPTASNLLRDVSCPSETTCFAVGASDPSEAAQDEQSLVEKLSGGTWTIETSPDRAGSDNHLWAVSCSNEANCVAAGQSQTDTLARPLIQVLGAGTWTLASPTPYRAGTFNYLYGLSCPTYRNCKAVGDYLNVGSNRFKTSVLTNSPL